MGVSWYSNRLYQPGGIWLERLQLSKFWQIIDWTLIIINLAFALDKRYPFQVIAHVRRSLASKGLSFGI